MILPTPSNNNTSNAIETLTKQGRGEKEWKIATSVIDETGKAERHAVSIFWDNFQPVSFRRQSSEKSLLLKKL